MPYNDRAQAVAQDPTPEKISGPNGHKARDEFICAVVACDGLTPLELKIAVRLAIYFNCTTGQCNPGYPALAKAIGVATRSARRAVASLVHYGIVAVDQSAGGSHDQKSKFSLFMPPARVTHPTSPVTGDEPDTRTVSGRVTRTNGTGDEQTPGRVTPRGPHNTEKENTESNHEERAYGPRSSDVEIQRLPNNTGTAADDASQSPACNTDILDTTSAPTERRLVSASVGKDQGETHGLHAPFCPIRIVAANGGTLIDLAGQAARRPDNQPHHKGHDTMARIARTREQMFANLKNMYPAKEPDDALSFEAFTLAIDHGLTPTELMMDAIDQQGYAKDGRDVPPLVEFLLAKCWIESVAA